MLFFTFIVVFCVFAVVASTGLRGTCSVSDNDKQDCGFMGVTQSQCESKGCCWASSSANNVPWCFFQSGYTPTSCFKYQASLSEPFSAAEVSTMRSYFTANINIDGKGGIVAAPDTNTPGGSYYYHWMRDGALTMRCFQETNPGSFSDIESTVKSYIQWVVHNQNEADPNGIDVRTEPKFMLPNGEVFTNGWCRPQNDGPGLRAYTLIMAAQSLISAGEMDYVKQNLWTGNSNLHGGAIKYDLDYIVDNYATSTCDLWEEVRDADFFWNRATMKKAMIVGAAFANQMGDSATAQKYLDTMKTINGTLHNNHYNGKYVLESNGRTQDSAVIVGFNDAYDESDNMFAPTSIEVANTVNSYNLMFCQEYAINTADTANNIPGILYGRYQHDSYAGGNPWVLSTAALANLFYRGASHILDHGVPSAEAMAVWKLSFNVDSLPTDQAGLAKAFAAQGDGVMLRLRNHVLAREFHLDEQIDRNTGAQCSAKNLTWSYAEVLNAMTSRNNYLNKAK